MASGGRRPGAGRPKKPATQKMLEGNPGRRSIEIVDFGAEGVELPSEPPTYLSAKAKEIYRTVYAWLKGIGCTTGILPYDPTNGKAMPSPFVAMAQQYLKQTNDVWAKIYLVVREAKLSKWDDKNPNDDIMEKLLGGGS